MIAFVILHFQEKLVTIKCVKSIKSNVSGEKKIIIVDNNSPNHTGYELAKLYEHDDEVVVLLNKANEGFAKGNNLGYRYCKKYNPKFIIVANSDILILQSDFTDRVIKAYDKYQFDILGPDIISAKTKLHQNPQRMRNYTLQELKKQRFILLIKNLLKPLLWFKYVLHLQKKTKKENDIHYTDIQFGRVLHGAFYVFSEKFIKTHSSCFYNDTFMYYESFILHHLGIREDLFFLYYPFIKILHEEDVSTESYCKSLYKASVFTNRCLLDSCTKFIKIYNNHDITIG